MRRTLVLWAATVWAGCGTTAVAGPRFDAGPARSLSGPAAEALAYRVDGVAREHRSELIACLDDLRARRDTTGQQRVTLSIVVHAGDPTVSQVQSRDPATVVDTELVVCLGNVVSAWSLVAPSMAARAEGDVELPVEVGPRPVRGHGALAEVDGTKASSHAFRPTE